MATIEQGNWVWDPYYGWLYYPAVYYPLGALDEKTWNAMNVTTPAAAGHIGPVDLYLSYPRNGTAEDYHESDFPVEVPLGQSIWGHASCGFYNDTDYTQICACTIEFIDPDGISRGKKVWTGDINGGGAKYYSTDNVTFDKVGIWKIHALFES
jgi:hypothetical protein